MLCGFGSDAVVPSVVSAATRVQYVERDADGVDRLKKDKAFDFFMLLKEPVLEVMVGGPTGDAFVSRKDPILGTTMIPCPTVQLSGAYVSDGQAAAWVDRQLSEGNAVLVSIVSVVARQPMCAVLRAVPAANRSALAAASRGMPVLAMPTGLQQTVTLFTSGFGLLVAVAGVAGVLAWASGVFKKKSHTPNRIVKRMTLPGKVTCRQHTWWHDVVCESDPGVGRKYHVCETIRTCTKCGLKKIEKHKPNRRRGRR